MHIYAHPSKKKRTVFFISYTGTYPFKKYNIWLAYIQIQLTIEKHSKSTILYIDNVSFIMAYLMYISGFGNYVID